MGGSTITTVRTGRNTTTDEGTSTAGGGTSGVSTTNCNGTPTPINTAIDQPESGSRSGNTTSKAMNECNPPSGGTTGGGGNTGDGGANGGTTTTTNVGGTTRSGGGSGSTTPTLTSSGNGGGGGGLVTTGGVGGAVGGQAGSNCGAAGCLPRTTTGSGSGGGGGSTGGAGSNNRSCPPGTVAMMSDACMPICEDGPLQTFAKGPWNIKYQTIKKQGLVFKDVTAGQEKLFNSVSVPHFKIESGKLSAIVRFCPYDERVIEGKTYYLLMESQGWDRGVSIFSDAAKGIDTLHWRFYRDFDDQGGFKGKLIINYDVVVRSKAVPIESSCEMSKSECYRFIPKISYDWIDKGSGKLTKFTAFYKLDVVPGTGLAPWRDSNYFVPNAANVVIGSSLSGGYIGMGTHETVYSALTNGQPGEIDSIHSANTHSTTSDVGRTINVPGCRPSLFDCIHMHWRWPENNLFGAFKIDPLVEPSTDSIVDEKLRGVAYLVPEQTIQIAIAKYNPGEKEEDPDNPLDLVANREQIATAQLIGVTCLDCYLVDAGHPIIWYIASASDKDHDIFFRHGIYVLNTLTQRCTSKYSFCSLSDPVPKHD